VILTIDQKACTRCDECLIECPAGAVYYRKDSDSYHIDPEICIRCSHCAAVCPDDAVRCDAGSFRDWNDPGIDPSLMKDFLCGKRSVRRYRKEPIPEKVIREILEVGSLTSTASNRQDWSAAILSGRGVREVASELVSFFLSLIRLANNPLVKFFLRFTYLREQIKRTGRISRYEEKLAEFEKGGDPFFSHAPVVVVLTYPRSNRRFGQANCVLAGQAMMYYAQSLGIGSCVNGFLVSVLNLRRRLGKKIGIPGSRKAGVAFALGYSDVEYRRLPIRRGIPVTYYPAE
jgi:nitroreductase/NAD-dependent dihydropyrimidine dehydrogenase PreA subunit